MISQGPLLEGSCIADYTIFRKLKEVTTYDLYEVTRNGKHYMLKLLKAEDEHCYLQQVAMLKHLPHVNIVRFVDAYHADPSATYPLSSNHFVVTQFVAKGDLGTYINCYGRLSEQVSRKIWREVVEALQFAAEITSFGIIHPNLLPSHILLGEDRQVQLCGWSSINSSDKDQQLRSLIFSCAEILICLRTSHMPFLNKNSPNDPLYKFVKQNKMNKFWSCLQKAFKNQKEFTFSPTFKQLIQNLFLGKISTLSQILESSWLNQQPQLSNVELQTELLKQEELVQKQKITRIRKRNLNYQKKHMILEKENALEEEDNLRGSCEESEMFVEDCLSEQISYLQLTKADDASQLIKTCDNNPAFIVACLKQHLKDQTLSNDCQKILPNHYFLSKYDVIGKQTSVMVQMYWEKVGEQEEPESDDESETVSAQTILTFYKNSKEQLLAEINVRSCSLHEFYAQSLRTFIQQCVQFVPV